MDETSKNKALALSFLGIALAIACAEKIDKPQQGSMILLEKTPSPTPTPTPTKEMVIIDRLQTDLDWCEDQRKSHTCDCYCSEDYDLY